MIKKYTILSLQKRILSIVLAISFLFLLLVGRLGVIQIVNGYNLQVTAQNQWTRKLPIASKRGTIFDRNGIVLANSHTTYNVYIRASNVTNAGVVADNLSKLLDINRDELYKKATNRGVSETLVKLQIDENLAQSIYSLNLNGVYLSENTKRDYPFGDFLTQILGYTTIDNIGQSGLELFYDKYLKGIDGESLVQSDITGKQLYNSLSYFVPAISGCDLTLTIDYYIQLLAEKAALAIMQKEKPKSATIVVMEANTGEVLAMTSKPSFDLNNIPRDDISTLNSSSKNLSIVDVYEPGSTFKVLTTAIALEEKKTTLSDGFYDPGYRIIDGERINCWRLHGHGQQTMVDGLCNSCNSIFVDLALRLGKDKLYEYYDKFGFGKKTNIDFAGESSGILMDEQLAKKVDIARMGFGQAIAVTPLQLISAISSVLNGGLLMKPYFVSSIKNSVNNSVKEFSPLVTNRVISEKTSDDICFMLEEVITKASGKMAFIPGYKVSGKTGTSQKYEDGKIASGKFTSSFVGAFPADNPKYVVLVIVDEPTSGAYYGSIVATPYAKTIFEGIIQHENYLPNENYESDLLKVNKSIEMPNLVGMSLSKAVSKINSLNLQYEVQGEGGIVLAQTPPPNTYVFEKSIVLLTT